MKQYVYSLIFCLAFAPKIFGSTLFKVTPEYIMNKADYVISARVLSIDTRLEEGNKPYQYITLEISKIHKQNDEKPLEQGEEIVIRQIGGTYEDITLHFDGMPEFIEGSEIFVNLKEGPNGYYYYVVGGPQGLYYMVNGKLISDTTSKNTLFVRRGTDGELIFSPGEVKEIPLEDMLEKLNKTVRSEKEYQ